MVQKAADAEALPAWRPLANAKKFQLETEAAGAGVATKATGFAERGRCEGDGSGGSGREPRARGLAEAAVIERKARRPPRRLRVKGESFKQ